MRKGVDTSKIKECSDVSTSNNYDRFYLLANFYVIICVLLIFLNIGLRQKKGLGQNVLES